MDIPGVIIGVQKDYKSLYYSDPMASLKVPVTLQAGYGLVEQGQTLTLNKSAAGGIGKCLPYNPTTFPASVDIGRAFLVADSVALASVVYVSMDDSYKFAVGDDLIINDSNTAAENLGAITAIDRTSETHRAKITFTTAIGATAFETQYNAHVFVEAGDNTNNYSDCVGILEKSVDTGIGKDSKGAVATLILGNCVLYEGMLTNLDAAAKADLSTATSFGQYVYIR